MKVYRYEHPNLSTLTPYGYHDFTVEDEAHFIVGMECSEAIHKLTDRVVTRHTMSPMHKEATAICGFTPGMHYCGCDSLESLREWFKGFNSEILALGFRVAVYEVPDKYVLRDFDGVQLVFEMDEADFEDYL